jgi:hypothetical protein
VREGRNAKDDQYLRWPEAAGRVLSLGRVYCTFGNKTTVRYSTRRLESAERALAQPSSIHALMPSLEAIDEKQPTANPRTTLIRPSPISSLTFQASPYVGITTLIQ